MHDAEPVSSHGDSHDHSGESPPHAALKHQIEHASHLLPAQGPITVFVHHNTLHAFEDQSFEAAVQLGANTYDCQPYLPEPTFRAEFAKGRITAEDIDAVLEEQLGDDGRRPLGPSGNRFDLRRAMLEYPFLVGPDKELHWLLAETDQLRKFRVEATEAVRRRAVETTKEWVLRDLTASSEAALGIDPSAVKSLLAKHRSGRTERWNDGDWESFTLELLWEVCVKGVSHAPAKREPHEVIRHRDLLLQATGRDIDLNVNELLIRYCSAFLDQGYATWELPERDRGFLGAFVDLFADARPVEQWLRELPAELRRVRDQGISGIESIRESLELLGVGENEQARFIEETLLALRGWAGMVWQMESNAEWAPRPAPRGSLEEYLAVRLILERLALRERTQDLTPADHDLRGLRATLRSMLPASRGPSVEQRAFKVFQLAQLRDWTPQELNGMTTEQWTDLVKQIETNNGLERRRIYHLAYERNYRIRTLDAILAERPGRGDGTRPTERPSFQIVLCIDEREESFRRHLEEVEPTCETFGMAGFFGAVMYYRGVAEAHFRPLCPVVVKPKHYVIEEPTYSFEDAGKVQAMLRQGVGKFSHRIHVWTRSFWGGLFVCLLGSIASIPLLLRVLFPRLSGVIKRVVGWFLTPPLTQLRLERLSENPGPGNDEMGYNPQEMVNIVAGGLRAIGLTRDFAPLVLIAGHGSGSLNNPQAAAYDCGACGGARGGPNARAFAQMANDPRVRRRLADLGIVIPEDVHFVGSFHNTCDDGMTYFDLDRLPATHRPAFARTKAVIDEARRRNAQERARRFLSADPQISAEDALRHVEVRAQDLSQTRPELGHATNAVCFVGRRGRTRGLFMDRRTFLTSYDPTTDDADSSILTGLLRAVIPVCGGISLEYLFSRVDNTGYGCGTKLPHNVTSLLGVMDGAASDLRPGLSWQMVEMHEPIRILFVIETTPDAVLRILDREPMLAQMVRNQWVQMATLDPNSSKAQVYVNGRFEPYVPFTTTLPAVSVSREWYGGKRDHLGFAAIDPHPPKAEAAQPNASPTRELEPAGGVL